MGGMDEGQIEVVGNDESTGGEETKERRPESYYVYVMSVRSSPRCKEHGFSMVAVPGAGNRGDRRRGEHRIDWAPAWPEKKEEEAGLRFLQKSLSLFE